MFDEMLRVLEFGREEKEKDQGVVEGNGVRWARIYKWTAKQLNECLFTWIILPEIVHLGIQVFRILMDFWFFWRVF